MVMHLLDLYHDVAIDTVHSLRERHAAQRKDKAIYKHRKKMGGFGADQNESELDNDNQTDSPLPDAPTSLADLERWEEEAQTWDLLRRLIQLRYPSETPVQPTQPASTLNKYSSGGELWCHFLELSLIHI